jgi:hypothetical protein
VAATNIYIPHVASLAMAEAIAMREGLNLDHTMGCNNVVAVSALMETI